MSELVPHSEQSMEEAYRQSLDDAVSRQPHSPAEAVALQTQAGILGPLAKFRKSLGLTEEQAALIQDYANRAANAARKDVEAKLTTDPLLLLDTILGKEIDMLTKTSITQTDEGVKDLQNARHCLRDAELRIKGSINKELLQRKEKGEDTSLSDIVADVCTKQQLAMRPGSSNAHVWPFKASAEGYFYTRLAGYNVRSTLLSEDNRALITKTVAFAKHGTSDQTSYQELHNIPTIVEGVNFEYSTDFRTTESGWTENGITFDQNAVLKIAQAPNLPPVEK